MDCGPRGDNRDEGLHVLGKRSLQSQEAASDNDVENIEKKKSKTQHGTQISEMARVSEHLAEHNETVSLELPRAWEQFVVFTN